MHYSFKFMLLCFVVIELITNINISSLEVAGLLILISLMIVKENFYLGLVSTLLTLLVIVFLIHVNPVFYVLLGIVAYDLARMQKYLFVLCLFVLAFALFKNQTLLHSGLILALCSFTGFSIQRHEANLVDYRKLYDSERNNRYELERTKAKLILHSNDVMHLTEIRERNRIAREIHDSLGHSIASIHLQLQASYKLYDIDQKKSMELLKNSIQAVSDSLTLLRQTVHNIKPDEKFGIDYIHMIIKSFTFCPVDFSFTGDYSILPSSYMEFISSCIKESLTNAIKYSNASNILMHLEIGDTHTTLSIKDDGMGCKYIKEGMGLKGMRERIKNLGGSISIDSKNGFIITCMLPIGMKKEEEFYESAYSG